MIFTVVVLALSIVYLWITLTKDAPKWGLIAMVLTTSLLVAERSIEISKGIGPNIQDHLLIPSLVCALVALGAIVHSLVQRLSG